MCGKINNFPEKLSNTPLHIELFKKQLLSNGLEEKGAKSNVPSRSCYLPQGTLIAFFKCWGPVFPAIGITLSFILQLVHRLPALSSSDCCSSDAFTLSRRCSLGFRCQILDLGFTVKWTKNIESLLSAFLSPVACVTLFFLFVWYLQ